MRHGGVGQLVSCFLYPAPHASRFACSQVRSSALVSPLCSVPVVVPVPVRLDSEAAGKKSLKGGLQCTGEGPSAGTRTNARASASVLPQRSAHGPDDEGEKSWACVLASM